MDFPSTLLGSGQKQNPGGGSTKYLFSILIIFFAANSALALDCYGTEPFWSADVQEDKVILKMLDKEQTLAISNVQAAWGYTEEFAKTLSDARGPVAIVKAGQCDDGMSDREFNQEMLLFIGTGTLYGCCGLPK